MCGSVCVEWPNMCSKKSGFPHFQSKLWLRTIAKCECPAQAKRLIECTKCHKPQCASDIFNIARLSDFRRSEKKTAPCLPKWYFNFIWYLYLDAFNVDLFQRFFCFVLFYFFRCELRRVGLFVVSIYHIALADFAPYKFYCLICVNEN